MADCEIKKHDIKLTDYYNMLGSVKQTFSKNNPDFLYSVFAYGSVPRFEVMIGKSDLDIIGVLKDNERLTPNKSNNLNEIIENIVSNNKNIRTSLHIWNRYDLVNKSGWNDDVNLPNSLSRFRDCITLYGQTYERDYLTYLNRVRKDASAIATDMTFILAKIRFHLRRLINKCDGNSVVGSSINYSMGKLLNNFSEDICFMHGYYPADSKDAQLFVDKKFDTDLFSKSFSIKAGNYAIDFFGLISWIDSKLEEYYEFIKKSKKILANNIRNIIEIANTFRSDIESSALPNENNFKTIMQYKDITNEDQISQIYHILKSNNLTFKTTLIYKACQKSL